MCPVEVYTEYLLLQEIRGDRPFKKYVLPLCMDRTDPFILSCDIPLSVMEHFRSAAFAPVIRALGFT